MCFRPVAIQRCCTEQDCSLLHELAQHLFLRGGGLFPFWDAQALEELSRRMQSCSAGVPDLATQQWFLRDRKLNIDEVSMR